jgi:hypothetical protein
VALAADVGLLGAGDWATRREAMTRLEGAGATAVPLLLTGLEHQDWRVRANCAGLLDHLADERCVAPLARALRDPNTTVRRFAVHAIGCQGCKVRPLPMDGVAHLVRCALADPSIRVRRAATHQLGCQEADPRAAAALRTILRRDVDVKLLRIARWALLRHAEA